MDNMTINKIKIINSTVTGMKQRKAITATKTRKFKILFHIISLVFSTQGFVFLLITDKNVCISVYQIK